MTDTIAAIATGCARTAIGILRISGLEAHQVLAKVFTPFAGKTPLLERPAQTLIYGQLHDAHGAVLDHCLATFSVAPASYTGEDTAELQCHGSPTMLAAGLEALFAAGARQAKAGEFTRRAFLNGKMDLTQAEADLQVLIEDLVHTMEREFQRQFSLIQQNFSVVFGELFGGGRAELVLSDPKDILNCDIDIIAQPPGKKLQLLSLLSGGERALTAIALLFAILKLKPTAFCILDEIEAALDEANVSNFASYVRNYSANTQFILITHRKGSMEVCDSLYGVAMEEKGVDGVYVPSADPHMSEYFSEHWKTRRFVSGFTGSVGTYVITENASGLWVDGRYYVQAEKQIADSEAVLFRASEPDCPTFSQYLLDNLAPNSVVGLNGKLFSLSMMEQMQQLFAQKGITLNIQADYGNDIWEDRPAEEYTPAYYFDEKYCGKSAAQKLSEVRDALAKQGCDALVVGRLDNSNWLFNVRANDIPNSPIAISYGFVSSNQAVLFTALSRVSAQAAEQLAKNGVTLRTSIPSCPPCRPMPVCCATRTR
mgnify:CR=1 FL=1